MRRRAVLGAVAAVAGGVALSGSLWRSATGGSTRLGGHGALGRPDANGLALPEGFSSRIVARSRQPVPGTRYHWHDAPDGGACFADGGGWLYVSNSEVTRTGGASAIRFRPDGSTASAYRILGGTDRNCAGGATPWGTWMSAEEVASGQVYETDPYGRQAAVRRPAMGRFRHEAAACDPEREVVYLTEDEPDGCFYRFRPDRWGELSTGVLDVLMAGAGTTGPVAWHRVPDPGATSAPTRYQVSGVKRFDGGEGCHYAGGTCWFTTKGDNRVWAYEAEHERIRLAYDGTGLSRETSLLRGVDNITGTASGLLYVAEDKGNMEINTVDRGGRVSPFLRVHGQPKSELTGPAFSPDGSRLYFSSQRGSAGISAGGITYEVTGPFAVTGSADG